MMRGSGWLMSIALEGLDRARFPSVAKYLERIPGGLAAYPHCISKASLLRSVLQDFAIDRLAPGLPTTLADLVRNPPPSGHWIPEVHFRAVMRAILDEFFGDPAKFLAWTYSAQQRLLGGPLYRMLFVLMTPERIARSAHSRWDSFHRGSKIDFEIFSGYGIATLIHPPYCYELIDHEATIAGFRVALELAGGRHVQSTTLECGVTRASSRISWR